MSTLTIRVPEQKYDRIKRIAQAKNISVNKLFDEWATVAIAEQDLFMRYQIQKQNANREVGLTLLSQLDKHFKTNGAQ